MNRGSHLGRVCFATPGVYPLLTGRTVVTSGGAELRAWRFLRGLEATGRYDLSLIAFDHSRPLVRRVRSIAIIHDPVYATGGKGLLARGMNVLRRAVGRPDVAPATDAAWARAGAQLYVTFGVGEYTGRLAHWAAAHRRQMLLFAGSDADFSAEYRADAPGRNWYGSRFDLCHAAVAKAGTVIVQTETQRELVRTRFGREARVIGNPIELRDSDPVGVPDAPGGYALWIGKANGIKRPDLLVELARACPDVPFLMVLNPADEAVHAEILASLPDNVRVVQRATQDELVTLFAQAFCLVNTSVWEGFPNTFLEAGRHRVPIASLSVDPDGVISRHEAGNVAEGSMSALAEAVRGFHGDRDAARAAGRNLAGYVRSRHDAPARLAEFDDVVEGLLVHGTASGV